MDWTCFEQLLRKDGFGLRKSQFHIANHQRFSIAPSNRNVALHWLVSSIERIPGRDGNELSVPL